MELSRGICILCMSSTKVVLLPQAESITNLLCEMLKDHIDVQKFTETSSTLKVCPLCLHDILQVSEHEKKVKFTENTDSCSLCQGDQHLILVTEWAHFNKLIEDVGIQRRRCIVCLPCIKYLDLFHRIKENFLKKYPHLELTEATKDKMKYNKMKTNNNNTQLLSPHEDHQSSFSHHSDTEFEREHSASKTNTSINLNVALKHLKPLTCSNFNIKDCKGDFKLLEQVAFVKLDSSSISRKHSKHGHKKHSKHSSDDSVTSIEASPKPSFFKIRLKLNPNKSSKSYKVMSGKVSKPKSKHLFSTNKKELIVKIFKMDLEEVKRRASLDSSEEELSIRTPTKASRKMLPDQTSSSKKRKSVTFAEDLNVEIIDGVHSRKNNTEGTPLKSLLKKNSSPTAELFKNGSAEHSSEEETDLHNNISNRFSQSNDSEDEMDASKSYVEEIQKNNDSIFDNLKVSGGSEKLPNKRKEDSDNEIEPEENDIVIHKKNNKKRRPSNNDSEIRDKDGEHDDEDFTHQENADRTPKSKKTNKRKRSESSDTETEELTETPDKINNDENGIESINKNKRRKSIVDESQHDESEEPNETFTKPQKLISTLDSAISISSDSSKEDRMLTLHEYKKIRKSVDEIDSGKNESIISDSEDILVAQEALSSAEPENKDITEENEEVGEQDEPETNRYKVSDDESNQSDTQAQIVHERSPTAPADDAVTKEPILDNDNNISDSEHCGLAEKDTGEQQHLAELSEKSQLTGEESSSVARVTTDDGGEIFSCSAEGDHELTNRNGDNVTPDEPESDRNDTLVSVSCSSDSFVTAIDGDKSSESPVK